MEDPLDNIDFLDVQQHGDPSRWKFQGEKPGSGGLAHSPDAAPGTTKIYELYKDALGIDIEVHYFRHPDGTLSGVKVVPPS